MDNMSIKAGTGATGLMPKGNTWKNGNYRSDAGSGTGGAISLANGGSVQGSRYNWIRRWPLNCG